MYTNKVFQIGLISAVAVMCLGAAGSVYADKDTSSETKEETVYYPPTLANFAKTYWRFMKFHTNDDVAIDNFMRISECDLYNEYKHNEFEWSGIREATRNFLEENKKKFPAHYQMVQPVSLGDYDFDRKGFNIVPEHAIEGLKRFEIVSDEFRGEVCGEKKPIPGYPKTIALELTRPLIFDFFELEEGVAKEIITQKMELYEKLPPERKIRGYYLEAREVYLNAKVKIFAYKPGDVKLRQGYTTAKMLGILERVEVYEDRNLTKLLYAKDLRRKKHKKTKDF